MPCKVALHTLGCKLNFSETSTIGNQFLKQGFDIVDFKENADVYVLNTCSVTENSEKECRQFVRRVQRQNPDAFIIVTGCYAQLRPEELAQIEGVDVILGSQEKFRLFSLIDKFQKNDLSCIFVSSTEELNDFGHAHSTDADSRTRAYFKIQDGCDYKCSFCTIPMARGKSRSLEANQVLTEFRALVNEGYKEIILTGVNVGDYGNSFTGETNRIGLHQILQEMLQVDGEFRIRISSIEPNLLTDEILKLTAESDKICKHFHIPLQSGSSRILKLMQRRYTVEDYSGLILRAKEMIPDLGIGVDVIVGFPGESETEFLETYNLLKELPISYLHVFTYSERPDTKAITMKNSVEKKERKKRNNMLRILSAKKKYEFYKSMVGKKLEVLFEAENMAGIIKGFSSNYVRVSNQFDESLINQITEVEISDVTDDNCTGKINSDSDNVELVA